MKKNKRNYQFTLVLSDVDQDTPHLEDALYQSHCDDALINFRNGTVYLDFDRVASSLETAVISAIKDVESAVHRPLVVRVAPENLVSASDIAVRLNVKRQTVSLWIKRQRKKSNPFPKPLMRLTEKSPLWKWEEVVEWLYLNQIIQDREIVKNAEFLENINAALEERDSKTRQYRMNLIKKLAA